MRAGTRTVALVALAVVAAALTAARSGPGADYATDAGRPLGALLRGDLGGFVGEQPLMGLFSVLVRAPFVALGLLGDAGELLEYRLGAFPCLLAGGLLGVILERMMATRGSPLAARAVAVALCTLNPMTLDALRWGHPEEVLAGALAVSAVLAAGHGRAGLAAVGLGLAIATKQWAIVAVAPALLATPAPRRLRLLVAAGAIAAALALPGAVADPSGFVAMNRQALDTQSVVSPHSAWWPVSSPSTRTVFDGVAPAQVVRYSLEPAWLDHLPHPLVVAVPLPLALLLLRRRPDLGPTDALGLLALVLLLRCVLDPWSIGYYHLPLVLALAAYEAQGGRGLPLLTMLASTALYVSFRWVAPLGDPGLSNAVYLAWTLCMGAVIARSLYFPQALERLRLGLGRTVVGGDAWARP